MVEPAPKGVAADLEARLARIDAAVGELLDLWRQGSDRRDELGRELVEERARNLELQRKEIPIEKALRASTERVAELERALAIAANRAEEAEGKLGPARSELVELAQALAIANHRVDESQRNLAADRESSERAQTRIVALEASLADLSGDLAEREHLIEELQQALRQERELRTLREAERDRLRQFAEFLRKSRWRKLGKAIGVVKTPEWEHAIGG
jgi:chromosome segregation ATPase